MQLRYSLILALVLTLLAACAAPAPQPGADAPSQAPATQVPATQAPEPTAQPTSAPTDVPSATVEPTPTEAPVPAEAPTATPAEADQPVTDIEVDMDELFPPGEGRDLTLIYCTGCHSFAPIVTQPKSADGWRLTTSEHRQQYVTGTTDEEYELITQYLINTYNPDWQVPELPPELLEGWTEY